MKCPKKGEHYSKKDMLEKHCSLVKSYWWHVWKTLFTEKIVMSHNAKYYVKSLKTNKVKSSDLRGLWKKGKDDFKEPFNTEENIDRADMLIDTATVNFGCASSSGQSEKDNVIEVV